jgi:Na+/glutamate symporter
VLTPLDRLATAFAAIDAAREYGFGTAAAMAAAAEQFVDLDRDDLVAVAAALAGLIATDLQPTGSVDMDWWAGAYRFLLASREREQ